MAQYASGAISVEDLQDVLSRYPKHVKADLQDLDMYRFETLPKEIAERRESLEQNGKKQPLMLLDKEELVELVTWKLKHGTFRPKLKSLVESNDEEFVHNIINHLSHLGIRESTAKEKMQLLTQMKGIGPATASLVLSCIWPTQYPFFSDELFRWIHWDGQNADGTGTGIKAGKGWARPIGYTPKEYDSLIARCGKIQDRLSSDDKLSFLDLEKVAYVLGKEKVDIETDAPSNEEDPATKNPKTAVSKPSALKKRTADSDLVPTSRSSRSKKSKN